MNEDLEEIRQELFRVHNLSVSDKDPMLALYTMNKVLHAQNAKAMEELLERFKSELEGIAYQWGNEAKEKSERILNASLTASKEAMLALLRAGVKEAADQLRTEFNQAIREIERPAKSARGWVLLNVTSSVVTLIAALTVAWSKML